MQSDGSKLILDTELLECAALTGLNNNLCNRAAETADDIVILNGDYAAGVSITALRIASRSMGLMVCISRTLTLRPSEFSRKLAA